jgi:hypothetical protein
MTEITTGEGKLYLAHRHRPVLPTHPRLAMGAHHDAGLVVAALNMAAVTRGGQVAAVIFHSDRGRIHLERIRRGVRPVEGTPVDGWPRSGCP